MNVAAVFEKERSKKGKSLRILLKKKMKIWHNQY